MKKLKILVSCVLFVALTLHLLGVAADILTPKFENRYYVLEDYLEDHPEHNLHDVKIFGSCHAYTSFNPVYMEEVTGVSGFVYANAGEIIPTTYARMVDQFEKHVPKVALVEIWGMNPYETYSTQEDVFGHYLTNNLERTEFSLAKQEIILDFSDKEYESIDLLSMNFPVMNYKDRILDGSLTALDFNYSFEETQPYTATGTYYEMTTRLKNNGYRATLSHPIENYPQKQNTIAPGEMVEIEPDIVKYIQKIIELCKSKDVELIFYRSPYISTVNELKKLNHLKQICDENEVLFIDLEAEIQYDYKTDFLDYQHLSEIGANKSTECLLPYIMDALGQTWEKKEIQRENLLVNSDLTVLDNTNADTWKSRLDKIYAEESGVRVDLGSSEEGWVFYQDVDGMADLVGESVTVYLTIADYAGETVKPIISFRDAENKEIGTAKNGITAGECTVNGVVPVGTESVRVGIYAWEGGSASDFVTVENIQLFQGAFTVDTLPVVIN